MKFYMPVRIIDEPDCVVTHASEWVRPDKKALIVTGKSSAKKSGALDDVLAVINNYCIYDGIEENPSVETIIKAAEYGLFEKAEYVIGIGGGSAMDAAKAIAFMMRQPDEIRERGQEALYDKTLASDALDVIAIPTTCGTGSEVTGVSVLTVHDKQTKMSIPHRIFPDIALIDGKYLKSAPRSVIVNTSVDAMAHMVESFLSTKADTYSMAAAATGLGLWSKIRDVIRGEAQPEGDRARLLMQSSTFAGIAIAQTGTSIPHALSYPLTYNLKLAHGAAVGYFLTGFIREANKADREDLLALMGFDSFEEFEDLMGLALKDLAVPAGVLDKAYDALSGNEARLKSCRFTVDKDVLKRIVYGMQTG